MVHKKHKVFYFWDKTQGNMFQLGLNILQTNQIGQVISPRVDNHVFVRIH